MSGKDLALLGLFLVVGHFLHRALVYWRYRMVEAPLEAGAFAEEALRRYLTGFRVRVGWRNGVRFGEREVRLTEAVMRGRSLYHLAVAAMFLRSMAAPYRKLGRSIPRKRPPSRHGSRATHQAPTGKRRPVGP